MRIISWHLQQMLQQSALGAASEDREALLYIEESLLLLFLRRIKSMEDARIDAENNKLINL